MYFGKNSHPPTPKEENLIILNGLKIEVTPQHAFVFHVANYLIMHVLLTVTYLLFMDLHHILCIFN